MIVKQKNVTLFLELEDNEHVIRHVEIDANDILS
jgi:hypothetical protein